MNYREPFSEVHNNKGRRGSAVEFVRTNNQSQDLRKRKGEPAYNGQMPKLRRAVFDTSAHVTLQTVSSPNYQSHLGIGSITSEPRVEFDMINSNKTSTRNLNTVNEHLEQSAKHTFK